MDALAFALSTAFRLFSAAHGERRAPAKDLSFAYVHRVAVAVTAVPPTRF